MRNEQHIQWLLEGVEAWNRQREPGGDLHTDIPDFSGVNLRAEFGNAGQISPDERIPLAGYDLSGSDLTLSILNRANLTGADLTGAVLTRAYLTRTYFTGADLTGADLTDADLTDADLTGADLTRADLTRADLTRADLTGADLTRADLTRADLTRAIISYADLTGAQLEKADLTDADLVLTICNGATFVDANFTRTNLTGTPLWGAKIYGVSKSPNQIQIRHRFVRSVESLLTTIKNIQSHHRNSGDDFYMYFRGEHQTGWKLQPSIMRGSILRVHESKMLTDLVARRPEEFNRLVSGLSQSVTAQHHGLQTRFLDVSSNPLVALFYACAGGPRWRRGLLHIFVVPRDMVKPFTSDTVSVIANYARLPFDLQKALKGDYDANADSYYIYDTAMEQLHQLIQSEKPYFVQRIDPRDFYRIIIVEPQQTSERIRAQAGAFLVSAFHERFERNEILNRHTDVPVYAHYQLTVPAGSKGDILNELRMLKITDETLAPGLDASAKAITEIYRQQ